MAEQTLGSPFIREMANALCHLMAPVSFFLLIYFIF